MVMSVILSMYNANYVDPIVYLSLQLRITIVQEMGGDKFGGQGSAYQCVFGAKNISTFATSVSDQSLTCPQPSADVIRSLPGWLNSTKWRC